MARRDLSHSESLSVAEQRALLFVLLTQEMSEYLERVCQTDAVYTKDNVIAKLSGWVEFYTSQDPGV